MSITAARLEVEVGANTREGERGLDRMENRVESTRRQLADLGGSMARTGATMTRRLTLPIVGLGAAVLKTAGDYQASMNMVQAVTGATGDEFAALGDLAQELGRTTQFSASQSADAMYFLASAGFDTNEVMEALPGTLQLAAAAQMDLATAADITSNVLAGYGMEVEELGRVNDVLVRTFQRSNTDLRMLGEAFKFAGPVAKGAGLEFEEAAAALGMMGNAGIQASMAGTSLRGAVTRLLNPTNAVAERMEALGLNVTDAEGNLVSLTSIISQLEESGATTADMMEIFGQRAGPAMAALVEQGSDALADLTADLMDAGGTAERVADVQMQGFRGAMTRLKSAVEGAGIAIAESGVLDFAADLAERLAGLFQNLAETNPELLRLGTIVAGAVAAAGPTLWLIGRGLGVIATLLSPGGLLIGGLAAAAMLFKRLHDNSEPFRRVVGGIADKVREVAAPILGDLTDMAEGWLSVDDAAADAAGGVTDSWMRMVTESETAAGRVSTTAGDVAGAFDQMSIDVGESLDAVARSYTGMADDQAEELARIEQLTREKLNAMQDSWMRHAEEIPGVIEEMTTESMTLMGTLVNFMGDMGLRAMVALTDNFEREGAKVGAALELITGPTRAMWERWGDDLIEFGKLTWAHIRRDLRQAGRLLTTDMRLLTAVLEGDWETAWDELKNLASGFVDFIDDLENPLKRAAKRLGQALGQGIRDGITEAWDRAVGKARELAEAIERTIRRVWDVKSPSRRAFWLGQMWSAGLVGGIESMADDLARAQLRALDVPTFRAAPGRSRAAAGVGAASSRPIELRVNLDRREIARVLYDPLKREGGSRGETRR